MTDDELPDELDRRRVHAQIAVFAAAGALMLAVGALVTFL